MSLIQIIQNTDNQELQTFLEEMSSSNNFEKTNQMEMFNVENILNLQICSVTAESPVHRNNKSSNSSSDNSDNYNINKNLSSILKQVNVSCCGLNEIPHVIFDLKYLSVLNLSNNSLDSLPDGLGNLYNLVSLNLSGNKLSSLPKSLKCVQQLNFLDISFNKFTEVPDVLYNNLRTLRVLDLSCNKITRFNDPPGCLNKLVELRMSDNSFKEFPVWIFNSLCQLKFLDISMSPLNISVKCFNYCGTGAIESLQSLNVKNCNLGTEDIQVLFCFKNLRVLHLGNKKDVNEKQKGKNYVGDLKTEKLKSLKDIKELYLTNVLISTLPTDIYCLKNIEILDLSGNLLSWLPECFCELRSLKVLNLAANELLFLPVNIGYLINLTQIHLENNKLNYIPESFCNLSNLEFADFYNNQIEKLNPNIFKGKNLKGIDFGFNCLQFDFCDYNVDIDEITVLYNHLKGSFRKHFGYVESRCDLQISEMNESLDKTISDSNSVSTSCSLESEPTSDFEDSSVNIPQQNCYEEENWEDSESCQIEGHEFFDPNEMNTFPQKINTWNLEFKNNYCPADYHVPPMMNSYMQNFKLAIKNDAVEEGQFDSD